MPTDNGRRLKADGAVQVWRSFPAPCNRGMRMVSDAAFARSTVLRAIDEAVDAIRAKQRAIPAEWRNATTWNRMQAAAEALTAFRTLFEEAPDAD